MISLCSMLMSSMIVSATGTVPVLKPADLPVCADLPDLFRMNDGSYVKTPEDWRKRREEIITILSDYEYGHMPPPAEFRVVKSRDREVLKDKDKPKDRPKAILRKVVLGFGEKNRVKVNAALFIPRGKGPFPVLLSISPVNEKKLEDVAQLVTERGYILAGYQHHDFDQDNDDRSDGMHPLYPDYDWATLSVWAWGASRMVDYLITLPEVDEAHIAITGHSRCGKTALLAATLDERIALAAPHASGCGGSGCFRIMGKNSETLALITDKKRFHYWFVPKLAEFKGKEDRLPFDQHFLKALIAPRPLLSQDALDDLWANPMGTQYTSQAVQPVYDFLGVPDNNSNYWRYGTHPMTYGDWEALIEYADHAFFNKPLVRDFKGCPFPGYSIPASWHVPQ